MKTVVLQSPQLSIVHEATVDLPRFPDIITFNNVMYTRNWISDKRSGYIEATVHAL